MTFNNENYREEFLVCFLDLKKDSIKMFEIEPQQVKEWLDNDLAILIDVREQRELTTFSIPSKPTASAGGSIVGDRTASTQ